MKNTLQLQHNILDYKSTIKFDYSLHNSYLQLLTFTSSKHDAMQQNYTKIIRKTCI